MSDPNGDIGFERCLYRVAHEILHHGNVDTSYEFAAKNRSKERRASSNVESEAHDE